MNDKNKCLHTRTNVHTNARSRERTFATQEKGRTISPTPETFSRRKTAFSVFDTQQKSRT